MAIFSKSKTEKEANKPAEADLKVSEVKTVKSKENTGDAYKVLVKPLVTEKSFKGIAKGQYVFKVSKKANKITVRNAVEKVYDVKVLRVNIISVHGKAIARGKIAGRTSDWKKAIVTLKPGQTIPQAN